MYATLLKNKISFTFIKKIRFTNNTVYQILLYSTMTECVVEEVQVKQTKINTCWLRGYFVSNGHILNM